MGTLMTSEEVDLFTGAQVENLTLFFRHFLNTPEEMDAHSGFKGSHERAPRVPEASTPNSRPCGVRAPRAL
jgi:hypothetical protein